MCGAWSRRGPSGLPPEEGAGPQGPPGTVTRRELAQDAGAGG